MVLSPGQREDKLFWEHERSGEFSIQSAYMLLKSLEKEHGGSECLNSATRNSFWKNLWRMDIPNKIKKIYLEVMQEQSSNHCKAATRRGSDGGAMFVLPIKR